MSAVAGDVWALQKMKRMTADLAQFCPVVSLNDG